MGVRELGNGLGNPLGLQRSGGSAVSAPNTSLTSVNGSKLGDIVYEDGGNVYALPAGAGPSGPGFSPLTIPPFLKGETTSQTTATTPGVGSQTYQNFIVPLPSGAYAFVWHEYNGSNGALSRSRVDLYSEDHQLIGNRIAYSGANSAPGVGVLNGDIYLACLLPYSSPLTVSPVVVLKSSGSMSSWTPITPSNVNGPGGIPVFATEVGGVPHVIVLSGTHLLVYKYLTSWISGPTSWGGIPDYGVPHVFAVEDNAVYTIRHNYYGYSSDSHTITRRDITGENPDEATFAFPGGTAGSWNRVSVILDKAKDSVYFLRQVGTTIHLVHTSKLNLSARDTTSFSVPDLGGLDVVAPYASGSASGGVLCIPYVDSQSGERRFAIYDYNLRTLIGTQGYSPSLSGAYRFYRAEMLSNSSQDIATMAQNSTQSQYHYKIYRRYMAGNYKAIGISLSMANQGGAIQVQRQGLVSAALPVDSYRANFSSVGGAIISIAKGQAIIL